jgi:hypothetical protein
MEAFVVRRTGWAVWTAAAFYQQLQSLNLGRVWQSVNEPVLVVYGTGDTVMSRADSDAIAETVNGVHPGAARNYVFERMNHLFEIDKKFDDALVPELLTWMKETLAASSRSYIALKTCRNMYSPGTGDPMRGTPWNYISRCEAALTAFENGGELPPGWTMPPVRSEDDDSNEPFDPDKPPPEPPDILDAFENQRYISKLIQWDLEASKRERRRPHLVEAITTRKMSPDGFQVCRCLRGHGSQTNELAWQSLNFDPTLHEPTQACLLQTLQCDSGVLSWMGIASYVRPSSSRPARALRTPPHCLKKNGPHDSRHCFRMETTQSRFMGRAPAPLSPPTITQCIHDKLSCPKSSSSGSMERNRTAAGAARRWPIRGIPQALFSTLTPHQMCSCSAANRKRD